MSLANTLLNGSACTVTVEAAKYSHSAGASRIAMESVAELHEIFMESFYNPEQAELAAATEGVALEGSQYEAVAEAAISNAMTKIKEFLKNLLAKVKAFFHNVKRYLDAIFMSGADFVKKYAQDIRDIGPLKDFEYKMYKYDDKWIDDFRVADYDVDKKVDEMVNFDSTISEIIGLVDVLSDETKEDMATYNTKLSEVMDKFRKKMDRDAVAKKFVMDLSAGTCNDPEEFDSYLFKVSRGGATDSSDKEDVEVKDISHYVDILNDSKKLPSIVDKFGKKTESAYTKAIKRVDEVERKFAKYPTKITGNVTEILRAYSAALSIEQTYQNKLVGAWKTVIKERDTAYKGLIVAAFSHAGKQKKAEKK